MLPAPRSGVAPPKASPWPDDLDDDDGWQDMPVVRSDDFTSELDAIDDKRYHFRPPEKLQAVDEDDAAGEPTANATGTHIAVEDSAHSWREKQGIDESEYTRLRLDEDEESEEVAMRTRYLFDEDKAMTPLSQMQATKELLTDSQRIAYVGLCALVARRMVRDMGRGWAGTKVGKQARLLKGKGRAQDVPVVEAGNLWMIKIMARLYQHMELSRDEQQMIDSLAEHGVDPADLVPALMATHTVKNPEFDPEAKRRADIAAREEAERGAGAGEEAEAEAEDEHGSKGDGQDKDSKALDVDAESILDPAPPYAEQPHSPLPTFDDDGGDIGDIGGALGGPEDEGDIGSALSAPSASPVAPKHTLSAPEADEDDGDIGGVRPDEPEAEAEKEAPDTKPHEETTAPVAEPIEEPEFQSMPHLPGVSTSITAADEDVTLDIRWTVLCDLFLVLVADSIYDSRSRAFLERIANALEFGWMDMVRFENRVTDALEMEERAQQLEQGEVIEARRKAALRKRYAMMGAAAVGGSLVIGLSAGLLAPLIGAGLGGFLGLVGVGGTTTFLTGVGGTALIASTGVLTGANVAAKGMGRRTREVRMFELKPLHNNKRVSCFITVGGFMAGKADDVRLPFSVMDSVIGDVFSVLWEPDMMREMGTAIRIIGTEALTQGAQQLLGATIMTGLMGALQLPMILTKLSYFIDNPWLNALDRAKAAGLVLADVLINRHAGVRPTSLIGFSLGARVIFYALLELARHKAYGIVQDVYLFGATVTVARDQWLQARSVVGGRFVNGYSSRDWVLGYLFRATTGGLSSIAGLAPVESVHGIENIEVTDLVNGHMRYRSSMPLLLKRVGIPVTADKFDEPDDPDADPDVQERYIVHSDDDDDDHKKKKKVFGIFPRRKKSSRPQSGLSTPAARKSTDTAGTPEKDRADDDDLPPRESEEPQEADLGVIPSAMASTDTVNEEAVKHIPKTAGFDFAAISKELGKDIDIDSSYKETDDPAPIAQRPPPERTESAPPPAPPSPAPSELSNRPPSPPARSNSAALTGLAVEDDGDIAVTAQKALNLDLPAWDRPAWPSSSSPISPPDAPQARAKQPAPAPIAFNAWSAAPQTGSFDEQGLRHAPPARPHPSEWANPFSHEGISEPSSVVGTDRSGVGRLPPPPWKKNEEDIALENPW